MSTEQESGGPGTDEQGIPLVCFDADVCRILRVSLRQLKRLRQHGFPIPELPRLDRHHRYSGEDVRAFLTRSVTPRRKR